MLKRFIYSILFVVSLLTPFSLSHAQGETVPSSVFYSVKVTNVSPYTPSTELETLESSDAILISMQVTGGKDKGKFIDALWSNNDQTTRNFDVHSGDTLIATCTLIDKQENCSIVSQQRSTGLILLVILFCIVTWAVTRIHGLRAILSMIIGLAVILFAIVPLIVKGYSPLMVTILGGIIIIVPSLYISHGYKMKSHIALGSIFAMTVVIGLLSLGFSHLLQLIGTGTEEALYLSRDINLQSVLLSAILLGTLGVIDDLALTQISIINELYHSNPSLSASSLYHRAMKIGQDHISSVINTLFLAYAGVSLPLLILIQQSELPAFVALQQEQIATEIMRTIIGTIGLILVVPLASYITAQLIIRKPEKFPAEAHHHSH
ncbi:MAG TPA: YibE/F family protein [Patescibacteria group bacterium]